MTTYISKGDRDDYGTCHGVNYNRNNIEYEYSYERSTATILVQEIHLETTTGLAPRKSPIDVVLPNNLQLPITDEEPVSPLFGTIAWEVPELGCTAQQMSNEHIEIFNGVVTVHKKLDVEGKSMYQDALVTHYADSRSPDQISFGFSIRHEVEICEIKAYQSNDPDISIIFLDRFDRPFDFAKDAELIRPHLTNAKTIATGMHIKNAFNSEQTAKELYDANCKAEIKTIRNLQNILRQATISTSLLPYFGKGYQAVPSGSVVHIIKCTALDASIDQSRDECTSLLPVTLYDSNMEKINGTRYADAVTRILSLVGTRAECSSTLPVSYKLDDGRYLCKGKEFFPCRDISIFQPSIADQAETLSKEFTTPLGIGIMAQSKITAIAHRAFEGVLKSHYMASQIYKNLEKGKLESLKELEPEFSTQYRLDFQDEIAKLILPTFHIFGRWTMLFLGLLAVAMTIGATCGCFSRTWTTYTIYGCSPRLFFSTFNGLHQLLVIIPNFVRGGYNSVTSRMEGTMDVTPLIEQINELRNLVYGSMKPRDVPPPYPHPTAPLMNHLFTEELFEETPAPPTVRQVYPDPTIKTKYKIFKEFFQRKSTKDPEAQINPDLNVDGAIASNAAGITASSIMPEHLTHLISGIQYAPPQGNHPAPLHGPRMPTQLAPPLPPPRPTTLGQSGCPTVPPPAPPRSIDKQESAYLPMAVLGPSTSGIGRSTMPSPSKKLKTQHSPQPLASFATDESLSHPPSPPAEGAASSTKGNDVPKVGNNYLAAKAFAKKKYPDVDSPCPSPMETSLMDSPMDTLPPADTPPSSPMEVSSQPPTPTAVAPPAQHPSVPSADQVAQMLGRPSADQVAQRVAKYFPRSPK